MNNKINKKEGEIEMNAYALKPNRPFVAKGMLRRTPASESNKKMIEFMDSHNFSVKVNNTMQKSNCIISHK